MWKDNGITLRCLQRCEFAPVVGFCLFDYVDERLESVIEGALSHLISCALLEVDHFYWMNYLMRTGICKLTV